jgi:predicted nucleic acid-binding protein
LTALYVETGFVLQLGLHQEEETACEELLRAAESDFIRLVIPAVALFEPIYKLRGEGQARRGLREELDRLSRDLRRTKHGPRPNAFGKAQEAIVALAELSQHDRTEVAAVIARIGAKATVVPMTFDIVREAYDIYERPGLLEGADALVMASIMGHATSRTRTEADCFLALDRNFREDVLLKQKFAAQGLRLHARSNDVVAQLCATGAMASKPT